MPRLQSVPLQARIANHLIMAGPTATSLATSFIVTFGLVLCSGRRGLYLKSTTTTPVAPFRTQGGASAIHDIVNSNLTPLVTWIFIWWWPVEWPSSSSTRTGATSQWTR